LGEGAGFTLEHYEGLAEAPVYLRVLGNTMRIALIATIANILIGYPLAHWMRGLGRRGRMIAIALVVLPFWVSILVRTYAWIVVLGTAAS
jgi:ABC-type spermidine/putrescine transport system permease subunit I